MRRPRSYADEDNDDPQEALFQSMLLLAAKPGAMKTSGQGAGTGNNNAPPPLPPVGGGGGMIDDDDNNAVGKDKEDVETWTKQPYVPQQQQQQQQQQESKKSKPARAPRATHDPVTQRMAEELSELVRSGLQYLYTFIGMLDSAFGGHDTRSYYQYLYKGAPLAERQDPVAYDPRTMRSPADLIKANTKVLGSDFMQLALPMIMPVAVQPAIKEEPVDARIEPIGLLTTPDGIGDVPDTTLDEAYLLNLVDEYQFDLGVAPSVAGDWAFSALDDAVFARVLEEATFALMRSGVEELRLLPNGRIFTLKRLMMSPDGVRSKFAFFCKTLRLNASGGNAYAGRANATQQGMVRNTTYMLSAGIATRRANHVDLVGARDWFSTVYEDTNPRYAQLQAAIEKLAQRVAANDAAAHLPLPQDDHARLAIEYGLAQIFINDRPLLVVAPQRDALRNLVYKRARDDPVLTPAMLRKAHTLGWLPVRDKTPQGRPNLQFRMNEQELRRLNDYNYLALMRRQLRGTLETILVAGDRY